MNATLCAATLALVACVAGAALGQPKVTISANKTRVGMGRPIEIAATVTDEDGQPVGGARLLPYVNGKRWGPHELTDDKGRAVMIIPLPDVGRADIVAEAALGTKDAPERWIWAASPGDGQKLRLEGSFDLPVEPLGATLWLAVDDRASVSVNDQHLADTGGWTDVKPVRIDAHLLHRGRNALLVEAENGSGPAGLLAYMQVDTAVGPQVVATDGRWKVFEGDGPAVPATDLGGPDTYPWSETMNTWPHVLPKARLFAGTPIPEGATLSNTVTVDVEPRELSYIKEDPAHLVGAQWEPWFTPLAANWATAQAVPLMGFYWSDIPSVTRQHMIWLMESGVDFLVVDWTNHIWGCEHWYERGPGAQSIVDATTSALDVLAGMRDAGLRVPKMVLYPGLNNGPTTTMTAVNEELNWIYDNYVASPRYHDLFQEYLGKPLVLIHNGGGPAALDASPVKVDDTHFTVRWHSSQNQIGRCHEQGFWSWMDGSLEPMVTYFQGEPECLTVSVAFFGNGGWLYPEAYGRRGGWTYVESFKAALKYRPRVIELHQFQEFAGQPEGGGYGEKHDMYVDSYSVELSDDFEPVSLTAPAYRGSGGWGYYYLNLTRALVDLYRQEPAETTVVAVDQPRYGAKVPRGKLDVSWTWAGAEPKAFTVSVGGKVLGEHLQGTKATVDLSAVPPGPAALRVTAGGTKSRYLLSYTEDSLPLDEPVEAYVEVPIELVP